MSWSTFARRVSERPAPPLRVAPVDDRREDGLRGRSRSRDPVTPVGHDVPVRRDGPDPDCRTAASAGVAEAATNSTPRRRPAARLNVDLAEHPRMDGAQVEHVVRAGHVDRGPAAGRHEDRVAGLVEAGLAGVHQHGGRLLLLTGVGVDRAVVHGELAAGALLEAGVHRHERSSGSVLAGHDGEGVRLLRPVDQRDLSRLPSCTAIWSFWKCIVSAIERFGTRTYRRQMTILCVARLGAAAKAGIAMAPAAKTKTMAAMPARACLRRDISSFLGTRGGVGGSGPS